MGKTLMPGQFTCPEQMKRNGVPGGAGPAGADAPPAAKAIEAAKAMQEEAD
ncbi:hypothetical protein [Flavonifractor plautii]|uniref:hypothetical protein n=1 Tax=Flavonifractor plautii TaxID=292800 RepID=UPI00195B7B7E|nr:hypothetical protein [Flavonifractor plautii]